MGRHAAPTHPEHPPTHHSTTAHRVDPRVLVAALAVLVVLAGGLVWWLAGSGSDGCSPTRTVRVTVAPEVGELTRKLLASPQRLSDGSCAAATVATQQPLQTVGDLGALHGEALPDVWVPDSSLWPARAPEGASLSPDGALAASPVVVATSSAAAGRLGWTGAPPSWAQAFPTQQPVSIPDLAASAEAVAALGAVRAGLGGGDDADNAVVGAVLAAARGPATTVEDALADGGKGDADAPLVPVSEQEVYAAHAAGDSKLVAVYPSDGSPYLDYPVVRVGTPSRSLSAAVDAVVEKLTSRAAHEQARSAGFRDPDGAAPPKATDAGLRAEAPQPIALDPADVRSLLARLASLTAPSRILAVFDVSASMEAPVGTGTRVTLARDAAKSALSLVPDASAIGLWDFAYRLDGDMDYAELVPTRRLDAEVDGQSQRHALAAQLDTLPDRLARGGTGLYDTTLAAVRAAQADFNPDAVNSVLIVTDGADDDDQSIGLQGLLDTLRSEANPARPVKVIGVALGPDADLDVLKQIADATGGAAYSAKDPADLQDVLFDALRQREAAG